MKIQQKNLKKELLQKTMMIQSEKLDREVVSEKEAIFFIPRIMFWFIDYPLI